jgi:hypothetical protein
MVVLYVEYLNDFAVGHDGVAISCFPKRGLTALRASGIRKAMCHRAR